MRWTARDLRSLAVGLAYLAPALFHLRGLRIRGRPDVLPQLLQHPVHGPRDDVQRNRPLHRSDHLAAVPFRRANISTAKFQIGTGLFARPAGKPASGGNIIGGASLYIMKSRPAAEQRAAWEFVKYAMTPAVPTNTTRRTNNPR